MNYQPYTYVREEGRSFAFLGTLMTLKASGSQNNGLFSLIEQVLPPGFATPLHVHHWEDEAFYILEGVFSFFVGGTVLHAAPGTFMFLPRDVPHAFRVTGDAPARLLQLTTPAGLEQGFVEMGAPTAHLSLPPPHAPTPQEIQQMAVVSAKYHVEQLGPPPEQLWSASAR